VPNSIAYQCQICKDKGFVEEIEEGISYYPDCLCAEARRLMELYEKSGISKTFKEKTFDNYITTKKPQIVTAAKQIAMKYAESFGKSSIMLCGQVGSGKTHLSIAIANTLLKKGIPVLYMQYREALTEIKQNMIDEVKYKKMVGRYQNAKVLMIDDLFKGMLKQGSVNDSEIRIMFEIINHRYMNDKPIIVSTEYPAEKLLDFDEAVGSRIIGMCSGYIVELPQDIRLNHRLRM